MLVLFNEDGRKGAMCIPIPTNSIAAILALRNALSRLALSPYPHFVACATNTARYFVAGEVSVSLDFAIPAPSDSTGNPMVRGDY